MLDRLKNRRENLVLARDIVIERLFRHANDPSSILHLVQFVRPILEDTCRDIAVILPKATSSLTATVSRISDFVQ